MPYVFGRMRHTGVDRRRRCGMESHRLLSCRSESRAKDKKKPSRAWQGGGKNASRDLYKPLTPKPTAANV